MQNLVEDFLQYLRHERGQSDNTAKTYAALLGKFVTWAEKQNLTDWADVELKHLMSFLTHERMRSASVGRPPAKTKDQPTPASAKRLSGESVYLEIAALRAFFLREVEQTRLSQCNWRERCASWVRGGRPVVRYQMNEREKRWCPQRDWRAFATCSSIAGEFHSMVV